MITREQALVFVRSVGWLSRLPPPLQAALLAVARFRIVPAETRLYSVGDPPGGFVGLVAGCLAAEAAQSSSPPKKTLLLHPGAWTGEGPVAGLDARLTGVWATRESAFLGVEIADFRRVASAHPDVWRHLVLLALENHGRTIGLAQDLMARSGRHRLLTILARLAGLREECVPDPAIIDATHAEVADISNLSRSVVTRFLKELDRDGLVRLGRATIEIPEPQRLLASIERAG